MFKKTIISEFFTTVSLNQALESLYLMTFGVYKLRYGKDIELLEKELLVKITGQTQRSAPTENNVGVNLCVHPKIISFYNGRSAIFHALKLIGIKSEDEVIVNAYNCVSVSNAVIQSGAKIIYSDIEEETLSFDFEILKKNISGKTKVIIIQHTFGKRARDYEKIIEFARQKNILIIEDCAHSLGNYTGHPQGVTLQKNVGVPFMGTLKGDFAIFSTGRDKVISSVTGGFLLINNENYLPHSSPLLKEEGIEKLKMPSILLTLKNLNYNIVGYKAYKFYDFLKLGKIIIFLSRKLGLITEILTPNEKACSFDNFYLKLPNSLAYLARKELEKLYEYTKKRLENIKYYIENLDKKYSWSTEGFSPLQNNYNGFRFPILLNSEEEKNKLYKLARKNNILLGNFWTGINIAPIGTEFEKAGYKIGSCPVAEDISKRILTLPNHKLITKKDLEKVVNILNNFNK